MTTTLTAPQKEHSPTATAAPREFHWTAEQFYRAADAGVFDDPARLELIRGRIIENMPVSPLHADTADYFAQCLQAALAPRFRVREEKPIHIAFDGEPTPDLSVVSAQRRRVGGQHPTPSEVVLLVEVAVSSVDSDLGDKALLYAQAGITDYWVVLVEEKAVVVHRNLSGDGYAAVTKHGIGDTVTPLAATDVALPVAALLFSEQGQVEPMTTDLEYDNA